MATKTWNGATASFNTDADWSDGSRPQPGDIALINSGSVSATGTLTTPLTIRVTSDAGNSPILTLTNATVGAGTRLTITGNGNDATLGLGGTVVNSGSITLAGSTPVISLGQGGVTTTFDNEAGLSVTGSGAIFNSFSTANIINNGILSFRNTAATQQTNSIFQPITGSGSMRLSGTQFLHVANTVAAGQQIILEPGAEFLQIDTLDGYKGSIAGFSSNDELVGFAIRWDTVTFAKTANGGTLNFSANGNAQTSLNFVGNYNSVADFTVTQDTRTTILSRTDIKTNVAEAPVRMTFIDTTGDVSGADPMTVYTGPVTYLNYEYIWNSTDDVVLGASVDNVFLHGGTGQDALVAHGGSNVLDGGAGSNFLIGATGTDGGTDTFFVDERGAGVTWSTLLNFHVGDTLNIFGFKGGVSTLPWTANDGTPGYTGATIHSEIGGAGTGVNGSVTFAGVSLQDVQTKFTITNNNIGGIDYLNVYNHG